MAREAFDDENFPAEALVGATGFIERRTDIVGLASGAEVRRSRWAHARRSWQINTGALTTEEAQTLIVFFEARQGRRFAFRFRDPLDYRSGSGDVSPTDQILGLGDGSTTLFPLRKMYGETERSVTLPIAGSVRVALNGQEQINGWSVTDAGVLFSSAPASGVQVSAGFLFDVPVRFGEDRLAMTLGAQGGAANKLSLVEVSL